MAGRMVSRSLIWIVICTCVAICGASPTRRQSSLTETTSSDPTVTNEGAVWDDTDDFDLDGDDEWMGDAAPSPPPVSDRPEYEEYDDDDDDLSPRRPGDLEVHLVDDDMDHQDAEEEVDHDGHNNEFLFLPSRDTRLMLQDDDDPSSPIKVRHTGKNSYSDDTDGENSVEDNRKSEKGDTSPQFEFTIDDDEEDEDKQNDIDNDDKDDFVLEDSLPQQDHRDKKSATMPRREVLEDDDDDFMGDEEDVEDDAMFESPEEDTQVIYGDHVFLY